MLLNNTSVTQLEECLSSKQKVVGSIPARGANTMPEPVDDGRRSSKPAGGGSIPLSGAMKYFTDRKRHLVCIPYSIENLHKMADELGIKRCWFHKDHYDIPIRRIAEIEAKCIIVSSKEIVLIIKGKSNVEAKE